MEFLKTGKRVFAIEDFICQYREFSYNGNQKVKLSNAIGCIVYKDIKANMDVPGFTKSTVDGYACLSIQTTGANPNSPIPFQYGGELKIGEINGNNINKNKVYYIPTGALLPIEFDSVIMIEDIKKSGNTIYFEKTIFKGENVIFRGEDIKRGDLIVRKGSVMRSVDIGVCASQGIESIDIFKKLKVAIIPTGIELANPGESIKESQIFDINSYMLSALFGNYSYIESDVFDIIMDDEKELYKILKNNFDKYDLFIISGGSSKGMRDITINVIKKFGSPGVLTHGLDISPGKPTILSLCNKKPIFGSPGHPVSSYISTRFVILPIIKYIAGMDRIYENNLRIVEIGEDIPSKPGIEHYYTIKLSDGLAYPIYSQSGMISSLCKADGIIVVPYDKEGLYKGEFVEYYSVK